MTKVKARTLSEFDASYNKSHLVPLAIRKGLAELGRSGWEGEAEFIKRCQLSTTDFAKYRGAFDEHTVSLPQRKGQHLSSKRAWCGSKEFATTLRDRLAQ